MKRMKEVLHKSTALLLAFLLIVSMGTQFQVSAYEEKTGKVTATTLYVRSGPGTTYDKLGYVKQDSMVTIVGEDHASDGALWYKIEFSGDYGYVSARYVTIVTIDTGDPDFETMVAQFPESYHKDLWTLHAQYPNWVFKPVYTHTNWADALEAESKLGHSLVHTSSISSWKSTEPGAYDWNTSTWVGFDGPSWVQASDEILAYYMDPRSYLDSHYVFTFLDYTYDESQNKNGIASIVKGTFMEDGFTENGQEYSYVDVIMDAAQKYRMNPYVLATIIRNEQGVKGSKGISGTVPGYEGYYNYYNIGAYATSTMTAIERGLWYAKGGNNGATSYNRPWNNRYDAVLGGANFYVSNYVGQGQNTIYLKKFNVIGSDQYPPYTHEYMTNVTGAASEGRTLAKAYNEAARAEKLIFEIPVYDNMPATASKKPTGDGSPNNKLADLTVDQNGLTPGFDRDTQSYDLVLDAGVDEITISATALHSAARVEGTGTFPLQNGDNVFDITVTAQNGQKRVYSLCVVADLTSGSGGKWKPDENGWRYEYPDGTFATDQWAVIGSYWYHFDANGYMHTGWQHIGSYWYYFAPEGNMLTGWQHIGSYWYHFAPEGNMQTGWQRIGSYWYHFASGGNMEISWQLIDGIWYYFTGNGNMVTGWQEIRGDKYYFDAEGHMQVGWQELDGKRYYFVPSGAMATGWQDIEDKRYYFAPSGEMMTGWKDIEDKRYYFYDDGTMAKDTWIDGQYVDDTGALVEKPMQTGWLKVGSDWYYYDEKGNYVTGWNHIGSYWYYFAADGIMQTGWQHLGSYWYYIAPEGNMLTGWQHIGSYRYYFTVNGNMVTGWQEIDGNKYYFTVNGNMVIGWQEIEGERYYFAPSGEMMTGWQDIEDKRYYFYDDGTMAKDTWIDGQYVDGSGALVEKPVQTGWLKVGSDWYYYDEKGNYVTGWNHIGSYWYYFAANGIMQTGWQHLGSYWYYIAPEGNMLTGWQHIGSYRYYFTVNGNMVTGWQEIDGDTYYFTVNGNMVTGWQEIEGKRYYFSADGVMARDTWIDGQYVDGSGALVEKPVQIGWQSNSNGWRYFDDNGNYVTGWNHIGSYWYYFATNGYMQTGWQHLGSYWYYIAPEGNMLTGWQHIGSYWYYFAPEGNMLTDWHWIDGKCYYFYENGNMAANEWIGGSYVDGSGAWVQ